MLNLSPSQNVTLDLLYCTATGCPVFCGLWGFFALFSVILVFSDINISIDFTECDACLKGMKECAILVHLQVKFTCEKYR